MVKNAMQAGQYGGDSIEERRRKFRPQCSHILQVDHEAGHCDRSHDSALSQINQHSPRRSHEEIMRTFSSKGRALSTRLTRASSAISRPLL